MRPLEIVHRFPDGFLRPPDYVDAVVLAAGVPVEHAVPASGNNAPTSFAIFAATGPFFASYGAPPIIPGGTIDDGTASELNPHLRFVKDYAYIGLVSPVDCVVTISFWTH